MWKKYPQRRPQTGRYIRNDSSCVFVSQLHSRSHMAQHSRLESASETLTRLTILFISEPMLFQTQIKRNQYMYIGHTDICCSSSCVHIDIPVFIAFHLTGICNIPQFTSLRLQFTYNKTVFNHLPVSLTFNADSKSRAATHSLFKPNQPNNCAPKS